MLLGNLDGGPKGDKVAALRLVALCKAFHRTKIFFIEIVRDLRLEWPKIYINRKDLVRKYGYLKDFNSKPF